MKWIYTLFPFLKRDKKPTIRCKDKTQKMLSHNKSEMIQEALSEMKKYAASQDKQVA